MDDRETRIMSNGNVLGNNRSFKINYKRLLKKRLPILTWLPHYNVSKLLHDLLAGFTVGLTEIPQAIAYAVVAGLSPEHGLYSGFMDGFIYAILGTCKDVNIGPTSIMSLLLQSHVLALGPDMSVLMTFMSGVIIFVLGLLNLGFVIEFFSYPVIAGFTSAASVQIASSQIKSLFGIPGRANEFLEAWETVFTNLNKIKKWDTILGVTSIIILVTLREIRRFGTLRYRDDWSKRRNVIGVFIFILSLARNALVVIAGTVLSYYLRDEAPFVITGEVKAGFPPFKPPPFQTTFNGTDYYFGDMVNEFGTSMIFMPVVSILEAISIAKSFSKGKAISPTQEMFALGLCNIMGSFVSSMPVTGSFTRTAVNNASGVKTSLAGIVTSLMVLLAIGFLTSTFYYIPKATLASVIICAMFYLFDYEAFITLWKNKKIDLVPLLVTFICCLFVSLEYGILIGIGVNLLFVLYASARPKLSLVKDKVSNHNGNVYVITPKHTLYFPAAEYLRDTVLENEEKDAAIVINGKYIRNIDVTVAKIVVVLAQEMTMRKQKIIFLDFKDSVKKVCVGINKNVEEHFKTGSLEDAFDPSIRVVTNISRV